jgi:site-specific recombinase XerC
VTILSANPGRDRLMLEVAYFGGLRVSELVSLNWGQVIKRDNGEAQVEIVGKGSKTRQVLIPIPIAARLLASRGEAPGPAPVFESVRNPGHALTERAVNFIVKAAAKRAGVKSRSGAGTIIACVRIPRSATGRRLPRLWHGWPRQLLRALRRP